MRTLPLWLAAALMLVCLAPLSAVDDLVPLPQLTDGQGPGFQRMRQEAPVRSAALRALGAEAWTACGTRGDWDAEAAHLLGEELVQWVRLPSPETPTLLRRKLIALLQRVDDPLLHLALATSYAMDYDVRGESHFAQGVLHLPAACPALLRLRAITTWMVMPERLWQYGRSYTQWISSVNGDSACYRSLTAAAADVLGQLEAEPRILTRERMGLLFTDGSSSRLWSDWFVTRFQPLVMAAVRAQPDSPEAAEQPLAAAIARLEPWTRRLVATRADSIRIYVNYETMTLNRPLDRPAVRDALDALARERPADPWPKLWALYACCWDAPDGERDWRGRVAALAPRIDALLACDPTLEAGWRCISNTDLKLFPMLAVGRQALASQAWDIGVPQLGLIYGAGVVLHATITKGFIWTNDLWMPYMRQAATADLADALTRSPAHAAAARSRCLAIGRMLKDQTLLDAACSAGEDGLDPDAFLGVLSDAGFARALAATKPHPAEALDAVTPDQDWLASEAPITTWLEQTLPDPEARRYVHALIRDHLDGAWDPADCDAAAGERLLARTNHPGLHLAIAMFPKTPGRSAHAQAAWSGLASADPWLRMIAAGVMHGAAREDPALRPLLPQVDQVASAAGAAIAAAPGATVATCLWQLRVLGRGVRWTHDLDTEAYAHLRRVVEAAPIPLRRVGAAYLHAVTARRGDEAHDWRHDDGGELFMGSLRTRRSGPLARNLDAAAAGFEQAWIERPSLFPALSALHWSWTLGLTPDEILHWTARACAADPVGSFAAGVSYASLRDASCRDPALWVRLAGMVSARGTDSAATMVAQLALQQAATYAPFQAPLWQLPTTWAIADRATATGPDDPQLRSARLRERLALAWRCDQRDAARAAVKELATLPPAPTPSAYAFDEPACMAWLKPQPAPAAVPAAVPPPAPPAVSDF